MWLLASSRERYGRVTWSSLLKHGVWITSERWAATLAGGVKRQPLSRGLVRDKSAETLTVKVTENGWHRTAAVSERCWRRQVSDANWPLIMQLGQRIPSLDQIIIPPTGAMSLHTHLSSPTDHSKVLSGPQFSLMEEMQMDQSGQYVFNLIGQMEEHMTKICVAPSNHVGVTCFPRFPC